MTDKLDMVYDMVKDQGHKMDKIIECNTKIKVKGQERESRIMALEKSNLSNHDIILQHIQNKDKHFNPYYAEGNWDKVKRKKLEIGTSVTLATLIMAVILKLLEIVE